MNATHSSLLVIALLVFTGCDNSSKGGPGATPPNNNNNNNIPVNPSTRGTFTLTTSPNSVTLKQGEAKTFTVTINRNDNFQEVVELQFTGMPNGTIIDPANPVIATGDTEVKFTLKSDNDAALGEFKVVMVGHPGKGLDSVSDLSVTIEKQ